MSKLVVMIIWISYPNHSPAIISGFDTVELCNRAIKQLHDTYYSELTREWQFSAKCAELDK